MLTAADLKGMVIFATAVALLLAGGLYVSRLLKAPDPFRQSAYIMGTIFDITALGDDESALEEAAKKASEEIRRIDDLMSRYKEGSEVSQINRNAGLAAVKVGGELIEVLKKARHISELSDGAFDVTIGPLSNLWGFDEEKKVIPSGVDIEAHRKLVDFRKMKIDEAASTVYLEDKGMMIDVGGIAKGYALKAAIKIFEDAGIKDVMINAGGNLNLRGTKRGKPWKIGIQDPRNEKELVGIINISDTSISTSGDYQRYFIRDGARFHHILDPKTGYPAKEPVSVTIAGRDETLTDAMSTAVFVLGADKGMALMSREGAEGVIIAEDGKMIISEGLKDKLSRLP